MTRRHLAHPHVLKLHPKQTNLPTVRSACCPVAALPLRIRHPRDHLRRYTHSPECIVSLTRGVAVNV